LRLLIVSLAMFALATMAACGGDDEASTPSASVSSPAVRIQTASPTSSPVTTPATSITPSATPARTATVYPSPPSVPDGWLTYSDSGHLYTWEYPPSWFEEDEGASATAVYSLDPASFSPRPGLPPEIVKVEILHYPAAGTSACGAISFDPVTNATTIESGSAAWQLGGQPAWLSASGPNEGEGGTTLAIGISLVYKGECFGIAGYYTQTVPDVQTFLQIAESLQFTY
jgi:hypothetical protein